MSNKYEDREIKEERCNIWREGESKRENNGEMSWATVPVIYYLSRNGQLEHPHFMEVPVSSCQGLFLTDVIKRLNLVRGEGMGKQYSWSAKRGYKKGYVWQDLEEKDIIWPANRDSTAEYILKGSEIHQQQQQQQEQQQQQQQQQVVLEKEEESPPPSDSTLESLMNEDGYALPRPSSDDDASGGHKMKPSSSILMSFISCASASFRECASAPPPPPKSNDTVYP